ncbi:hypothetical protein RF11_02080 [Thelohanellus kitauei]|uniref:Uncharacterized protein n=1 Tax=Thelohanellus kitauei TaxID=669202 RepID=A0A0C2MGZ3_THEKT|nr:hypothetical protein RF11_02080 [Thelohanellus kitauei]
MVEVLSRYSRYRATQKFRIIKAQRLKKVRLSISYMMIIKSTKDFHITLKVEPVVDEDSPYELKSIIGHESQHHVSVSFKFCKTEWLKMIFSALTCCILLTCLCFLIYSLIGPEDIQPIPKGTSKTETPSRAIAF